MGFEGAPLLSHSETGEEIMDQGRKFTLTFGLLLILLGMFFLAVQFVPGLEALRDPGQWWPLFIVGWGVALLVLGLVLGVPALAVPACIVGGIGLLLFWQNSTNNWDSWAYAWALIPGFVGVGILLSGLLSGKLRETLGAGLWLLAISAVLFAVFGSLLGGPNLLGTYWPILLIVLGVSMLLRGLLHVGHHG